MKECKCGSLNDLEGNTMKQPISISFEKHTMLPMTPKGYSTVFKHYFWTKHLFSYPQYAFSPTEVSTIELHHLCPSRNDVPFGLPNM